MNARVLALFAPIFLGVIAPSTYLALFHAAYVGSLIDRAMLIMFALGILGVLLAALEIRLFLLVAVGVLFAAPLEIIHISIFHDSISMGMLNCALDTNPLEVREMLGGYLPVVLLCFLLPGYSLFLFVRTPVKRLFSKRSRALVLGLSLMPFLMLGIRYWHWGFRGKVFLDSCRATLSQTFPLGTALKLQESLQARLQGRYRDAAVKSFRWNSTSRNPGDTAIIVLIIGESSRSDHWQINGYSRPTNPKLSQDTSLISFRDATSSANITNESISQLLSLASPQQPELFGTSSSLLSGFSEAGWQTFWVSNQGSFSAVDAKQSQISKEANSIRFLPHMVEGPLSHKDGDMLPYLDSALASNSPKKLIVVHTMGSHFRYYYRYPDSFNLFSKGVRFEELTTASPRYQTEIINSYDNSIVYTDWVLSEIVGRIYGCSSKAIAIYISDHGESLFDGTMTSAGHGAPNPNKQEFQVPLVVAANSSWKAANREKWELLKKRAADSVSSEAILPTLFELADIQSPYVSSQSSLASPHWLPAQRLVTTTAGHVRAFEELPR